MKSSRDTQDKTAQIDALTAAGRPVIHILGIDSSRPHELNPNARVSPQGVLTYLVESTEGGQKRLW